MSACCVCKKLVSPSTTVVTLEISAMAMLTLANSSPTSVFKVPSDPFIHAKEAFKLCKQKYKNLDAMWFKVFRHFFSFAQFTPATQHFGTTICCTG